MREEIISELIKTFSVFNRAKTFMSLQTYTKGENILLKKLDEIGGESSPSQLMNELEMTGPRVTAILRSLEFKKLVERKSSSTDKRKTLVKITVKGKKWIDESTVSTVSMLMELIDRLGEEDTQELMRIMRKLLYPEKKTNGEEFVQHEKDKTNPENENTDGGDSSENAE